MKAFSFDWAAGLNASDIWKRKFSFQVPGATLARWMESSLTLQSELFQLRGNVPQTRLMYFQQILGNLYLVRTQSVHLLLRFCCLPSLHSHLPFWTFPSTYWGALFPIALGVSVPAARAGGSHPPELSASSPVLVSLDSCFMNPLKGAGVVLKVIHF